MMCTTKQANRVLRATKQAKRVLRATKQAERMMCAAKLADKLGTAAKQLNQLSHLLVLIAELPKRRCDSMQMSYCIFSLCESACIDFVFFSLIYSL